MKRSLTLNRRFCLRLESSPDNFPYQSLKAPSDVEERRKLPDGAELFFRRKGFTFLSVHIPVQSLSLAGKLASLSHESCVRASDLICNVASLFLLADLFSVFPFSLLAFLESKSHQSTPLRDMLSFKRNSLPSSNLPINTVTVKDPSKLKKRREREGEVKEERWSLFRRKGSVDSDKCQSWPSLYSYSCD